jgi:hypothetical protein
MRYELSLVELESELAAELPTRNLLRRRRRHGGTSAKASFGSGANANSTDQQNFNPQTVVNTGRVESQPVPTWTEDRGGGISVESYNQNDNSNTQTATPINFGLGN